MINFLSQPRRETNPFRKTSTAAAASSEKCDWEFSRHKLRVLGILGEGCFGQVKSACFVYSIELLIPLMNIKGVEMRSDESEIRRLIARRC